MFTLISSYNPSLVTAHKKSDHYTNIEHKSHSPVQLRRFFSHNFYNNKCRLFIYLLCACWQWCDSDSTAAGRRRLRIEACAAGVESPDHHRCQQCPKRIKFNLKTTLSLCDRAPCIYSDCGGLYIPTFNLPNIEGPSSL